MLEDSGAQTVTGWATALSAGPADESAQTLTFIVTNNTNAALFSAGAGGRVERQADVHAGGRTRSGRATVTLRLDDNGGTANGGVNQSPTQTFSITVTGVNDAPSFTKGADQTVLEDAGAQTVSGWATAIDRRRRTRPGRPLTFKITNNTNAALFSAGPAVSGTTGDLTYTPAANANGIGDDHAAAHRQRRHRQRRRRHVGDADLHHHGHRGQRRAELHEGRGLRRCSKTRGAQTVPGWATAISAGPADESGQIAELRRHQQHERGAVLGAAGGRRPTAR